MSHQCARLYCAHDIIWRTVHRKKFTHVEEELIDQFLLNAAHERDKAGFKVTFKPNRNTKAKSTSDWDSVTDIARYELSHQGKKINA